MRISDWSSDVCSSDLCSASLWNRTERVVGHRPGKACSGPGDPHPGLAAQRRMGRRLPLSPGQWPGRARLRRRARLQEPLSLAVRSEEHTSELQSLMRISYAVFCLKKKKINTYL